MYSVDPVKSGGYGKPFCFRWGVAPSDMREQHRGYKEAAEWISNFY